MKTSLRLYRLFLRFYPARFREEYAGPLEKQFRDELADSHGAGAVAALWLRTIADLGLSVPAQLCREFRQDAVQALRMYARRPLLTAAVIIALAFGIGANTAVFSVISAIMLRDLPFRDPDRLVILNAAPTGSFAESRPRFADWMRENNYLEDAVLYASSQVNLTGDVQPVRANVTMTPANFFAMLGNRARVGRDFVGGEDVPGKPAVAVISDPLWKQLFASDPAAIGKTVFLSGVPVTIIGVAAPGFDFPSGTQIWTPLIFDNGRLPAAGVRFYWLLGRLRSGVTVEQVRKIRAPELAKRRRPVLAGIDFVEPDPVVPLWKEIGGQARRAMLVLFGAVVFALLAACANVANLMLTRTLDRQKELLIRAALGAGRARLFQQVLTECVLLATAAGALGLAVAYWGVRVIESVQPPQLASQGYVVLDARVLAFTAAVSLGAGVLFGVAPAWRIGRMRPANDFARIKESTTPAGTRLRAALTAVQAALVLVLLAGAVTMIGTLRQLLGADLGIDTRNVLTLNVSLHGLPNEKAPGPFYATALERLRSLDGVVAAGGVSYVPMSGMAIGLSGAGVEGGSGQMHAMHVSASPGYLKAIGARLLAGRDLSDRDANAAERPVIVTEEFARDFGGAARLPGRRIQLYGERSPSHTIVGVVAPIHESGPARKALPQVYFPGVQSREYLTFVVRTQGDAAAHAAACRDIIHSADPRVPIYGIKTLEELLASNLAKPRFYSSVLGFFGVFTLLLSACGIYGSAAYSIARRRHELGVRMAVGATRGGIRAALLRQSLWPVLCGSVAGSIGSLALGRILRHLLYGAEPVGAGTAAVAALLLVAATAVATWRATARVSRLDPVETLRAE